MKRDHADKAAGKGKFEAPLDYLFEGRPNLADACANPFWDDKTEKGCWTLSLSWETGMCQASLNDKAEKRSLNTTAESSTLALDLLEDLLASERRPWRYWGGKKR